MNPLLQQIKERRIELGLRQHDMLRAGMSRQQYQRIETKGNPTLNTLEHLAERLDCELVIIPKNLMGIVESVLDAKGLPEKI